MNNCHEHFSSIAPEYRRVRTTDEAPIRAICSYLNRTHGLNVADIGCGTGRYSELLFQNLGPDTQMVCVDVNRSMLHQLGTVSLPAVFPDLMLVQASASALPLQDGSIDVIVSFNAIHHFDLPEFLRESRRVIREGGGAFLYTRLIHQNATTIWGKFFPGFHDKESRLYTKEELKSYAIRHFQPAHVWFTEFSFNRQASLETLLERAKLHHYSTFSLYEPDELDYALEEFAARVRGAYDGEAVQWTDSYTLVCLSTHSVDGYKGYGTVERTMPFFYRRHRADIEG